MFPSEFHVVFVAAVVDWSCRCSEAAEDKPMETDSHVIGHANPTFLAKQDLVIKSIHVHNDGDMSVWCVVSW